MIFPPILNSYYPMKSKIFVIKKKIIRIDNADTFSQPPLNIFTKGANNYDHVCKCRLGEQKRILNKNITNLTVQKLLTDSIYLYLFFFQK